MISPLLNRRHLLAGVGAAALAAPAAAQAFQPEATPMVDTHIHLFDPNRPQGAPYRGPRDYLTYTRGASPAVYREVMAQHNVVAAIKVEASAWFEDNLWALQEAETDEIMVGVVGNFRIEAPDFPEVLARHARHPLLRGLRYGNLWRYDLAARSREPEFLARLNGVAEADLVLEAANPRLDLIEAIIRVNDAAPNLRVIIDHLCKYDPTPEEDRPYRALLREISTRPNIFVKLSSSLHATNRSHRWQDHRERLDLIYDAFGPDRVLFGTDWPNVEGDGPVHVAISIVQQYFARKPRAAREKFFWRNSLNVYKWQPRSEAQRAMVASVTPTAAAPR
jgi:L-fuconolactonase